MSDKTYYLYRDGQMEDVVIDPTQATATILKTAGRDVEIRDENNQRLAWKEVQESKGFVSSFAVADRSESATVGMTPEFRSLVGEEEPTRKKPAQQRQEVVLELDEANGVVEKDHALVSAPTTTESALRIEAVEPRDDKPTAYYLWKEDGRNKDMVNVAETASDALMMLNQERHEFKDVKLYLADEHGNKLAWREWQQETYGALDQKRDVSRIVFSDEMLHDVAAEVYPLRDQVQAGLDQKATLDQEPLQQSNSGTRFAQQAASETPPASNLDEWKRQAESVRARNQEKASLGHDAGQGTSHGLRLG